MPMITIVSPTGVEPDVLTLTRDDQTILWRLKPKSGLTWGSIEPIHYLPAGGRSPANVPYENWPATASHPQPVDPNAPWETRDYWASVNQPVAGDEPEWYRYEILVEQGPGPDMYKAGADGPKGPRIYKVQIKRKKKKKDGWYDPDVVNDPQP